MVIDFRSRPPYKSFATRTALFPRKVDEDFEDPRDIPALNMNMGDMESARQCDMALYFKEMEEAGIDLAVVHGRQTPTEGYVPNDDIIELIEEYPGKFIGFAGLDLTDIDKAIKEMERTVVGHGFKGISVEPGYFNMYIDDERLMPLYKRCEELGAICSLTASIFVGPDMSYCHPVHIQRVAQKFPNLKIAIDHGCWPYVQEALGLALYCKNIYLFPDFYGYIPNMPFADEFVKAANYYLKYRMLFASGYPIRAQGQSLEQFKALDFREDVREYVLYKNAQELLGL